MNSNILSTPIQSTWRNPSHKIEDGNIIQSLVEMFVQIFENPAGQNLVEATRQFFLENNIDINHNEAAKITEGVIQNLRVDLDSNDSDNQIREIMYEQGKPIVVNPDELVRVIFPSEGMSLKETAKIENLVPQMKEVFPAIISIWNKYGAPEPVITSGNDSKHVKNSKHYENRAIDIRGKNVSDKKLREMAAELQRVLGPDYFVQAEFFPEDPANDHIHVQYNG